MTTRMPTHRVRMPSDASVAKGEAVMRYFVSAVALIALGIVLLTVLAVVAHGQEALPAAPSHALQAQHNKVFTLPVIASEAALWASVIADAHTTNRGLAGGTCVETNGLIAGHPTPSQVNAATYGMAAAV